MAVLDAILKKTIIDNETINVDHVSSHIDIDNRESAFSIQISYDNGAAPVDVDFFYELSTDGVTFLTVETEKVTVTDTSGNILYDIADTGASYLRVGVTVRTGSVDVTAIYSGKRRH